MKLYPYRGGIPRENRLDWKFRSGARLAFSHLQYESDLEAHRGDQICLLQFDQLESFTEKMFWFMLHRNRSTCGIEPYVRATCNPDPESFIADLIAWWIDQETGYPIPERSGVIRWFYRRDGKMEWGDTAEELISRFGSIKGEYGIQIKPKSFTFIPAQIWDNKIGLELNPDYLSNLLTLSLVERERLLKGNWKIRAQAGTVYKYEWLAPNIVDALPVPRRKVRCWDAAGTEENGGNDPAFTSGVKMSMTREKRFFIEDRLSFRGTELTVENTIKSTAKADTQDTTIVIFQDPGQAGKGQAERWVRMLSGYNVIVIAAVKGTGKLLLARPVSAQFEAGNIKLLRGLWNKEYIERMVAFPDGKFKDDADATGGAFKALTELITAWGSSEC
jgi:predicted phage terminase large subunit-like protein